MDFEKVKELFTAVLAVVAAVSGIIFWVQHVADEKVQSVQTEIVEIKKDIKSIEDNNREILRIVGRLEGTLRTTSRNRRNGR
jgi:hypothetical protein